MEKKQYRLSKKQQRTIALSVRTTVVITNCVDNERHSLLVKISVLEILWRQYLCQIHNSHATREYLAALVTSSACNALENYSVIEISKIKVKGKLNYLIEYQPPQ